MKHSNLNYPNNHLQQQKDGESSCRDSNETGSWGGRRRKENELGFEAP